MSRVRLAPGPLEILAVDVGDEPARRDGVDAHALEGEFEAERLGHLDDGGLGGRIGDGAFRHADAEHRGDVDDRAFLVRGEHAPRGLLRPEEHRVEIGADHVAPFVFGEVDGAGGMGDAGVVDQDGHGAERLLGLIEGAVHLPRGRARRPRRRWPCRRPARSWPSPRRAFRPGAPPARPTRRSPPAPRRSGGPGPPDAPVTIATRPLRSKISAAFISSLICLHKAHAAARSQAPAGTTARPGRRAGSPRTG